MIDPRFGSVLSPAELDAMERDSSSIVGVWPDLKIAYWNAGWERFARENGGEDVLARWPIGTPIFDGIEGPLRERYEGLLKATLARGEPTMHLYACPSPTEERQFQVTVRPLDGKGLILVHSLHVEKPAPATARFGLESYRRADGSVVQCASCRRTRRIESVGEHWDWVPAFVAFLPPGSKLEVCGVCEPTLPPRA